MCISKCRDIVTDSLLSQEYIRWSMLKLHNGKPALHNDRLALYNNAWHMATIYPAMVNNNNPV